MTVSAAEFDRVNGDRDDAELLIEALKNHNKTTIF
jgi:hypothetical protein